MKFSFTVPLVYFIFIILIPSLWDSITINHILQVRAETNKGQHEQSHQGWDLALDNPTNSCGLHL